MHAPMHIRGDNAIYRGCDGRNGGRYSQYMRTLCKIMGVFDGYDVEERELSPLLAYQTASWE